MGQKRSTFQNFPSFIVKNAPENPALGVGVFLVSMFCLLSHLCFSCLSFSSVPPLLDFWKPRSGPSNEVIGFLAMLGEGEGEVQRRREGGGSIFN